MWAIFGIGGGLGGSGVDIIIERSRFKQNYIAHDYRIYSVSRDINTLTIKDSAFFNNTQQWSIYADGTDVIIENVHWYENIYGTNYIDYGVIHLGNGHFDVVHFIL